MPLSPRQRQRLQTIAAERGLDAAKLIAEAEAVASERTAAPSGVTPQGDRPPPDDDPVSLDEQPKLFMYHLPFVTVNEVRQIWLGLEPWSEEEGGEDIAAEFAAAHGGGPKAPPPAGVE